MNPFEPDPSGEVTRLPAATSGEVSDEAYDATAWDGVTDAAPSKNAVRDAIESLPAGGGASGDVAFTDTSGALSVESNVADGASVVAFTFNTSNALSNGSADLVQFQNNGTTVYQMSALGFLGIYAATPNFWMESANSTYIDLFVQDDNCYLDFNGLCNLQPTVSDSGASAYKLNTLNALTTGKVLEVLNANTTLMGVGPTPTAGQTGLYLYDADNDTLQQVTLGAADSGGLGFRCLRIPNAP